MRFRAGVYAVLLLVLAASPCAAQDQSNVLLKTCTLMACGPEFVLFIRVADGSEPTLLPDITIVADGRTERCPGGPMPDPMTEGYGRKCDEIGRINTSIEHDVVCELDIKCKYAVLIHVSGKPRRVQVTINGKSSETATFVPKYEIRSPNGPDCEPKCPFARALWTVRKAWSA